MTKLAALIVSSFLFISLTRASEPVDSWGEASRPANSGAPISIVFGNGIFVAGGLQGTILTSTNGVDWTKQNSGISDTISRIKFVNEKFFAFSPLSPDPRSPPPTQTLISSDGVTWTVLPNIVLVDVTFGNNKYYGAKVVLSTDMPPADNAAVVSEDLVVWQALSLRTKTLSDVTYANGLLVARDNGPSPKPMLKYSIDGQTWTDIPGVNQDLGANLDSEITYQNGTFFMLRALLDLFPSGSFTPTQGVHLSYSLNGTNWVTGFNIERTKASYPLKIATGGQYYVFPAGNSMYYNTTISPVSPQAPSTNWNEVPLNIANPETVYSDVAFGNELFVAVSFGKIFKSNPVTGFAPLRMVKQPVSISANVGGTANLFVLAQGSDPITYQWRKDSNNISGATTSSLTLTNIAMADAGEYDVVITNPGGSLTSDKAVLSVHFADVNMYAGVTLRGNIGDTFLVEYQDQLDPSGEWHYGANVTLTTLKSIWFDAESGGQTNRFYRATFQGQ
jgi:hypothetical protein